MGVHRAIVKAGGTSSGLTGPALIEAAAAHADDRTVASLLSELAVEPLRSQRDADVRYVSSVLAAVQENLVGRQIGELKSRLQRLSPVDAAEEYRALFGDLVALEQYRIALREQAANRWD